MSTLVSIDINVRLGEDSTYAGLEDVDGEVPAVGDIVEVRGAETDLGTTAEVTSVDAAKRLIYLRVSFASLRPVR